MAVTNDRFVVFYHKTVVADDIPQLSPVIKARIKDAIGAKLFSYPEIYGKPLRRTLIGLWKIRVGDYRIIYQIQGQTVLAVAILHRSAVFKR